ncbi:phage/plasmid primase, P4 family [Candidatus Njordibacter sp. Uisw_002]|uniref:phage/plasmid primase, P4 family n=1 Tax=Candidatus Njordibacter sp. Uisw_002 TaxID=3230971 RepID=UPI003D4B0361
MEQRTRDIIEQGYPVFPCVPNKKIPITSRGFYDASADKEVIKQWWAQSPKANIGLATGAKADLLVIDVDVKNGAGGLASMEALEFELGPLNTRKIVTPSGGYHLYFKHPRDEIKNTIGIRPGIDIKTEGGYVLAAGSVINGNPYYVENDIEAQELPQCWIDVLAQGKPSKQLAAANDTSFDDFDDFPILKGSRNDELFRLASSFRARDMALENAVGEILQLAKKCVPPLPQNEAMVIVNGVYERYEPGFSSNTDLGNSKRLVRSHGEMLHYLHEMRKWIYWDNSRWVIDEDGKVMRYAKQTAISINEEASQISDDNRRSEAQKHAKTSESLRSLSAMIDLAKTEEGVPLPASKLDTKNFVLGVNNGVVSLQSGELIAGSTKDLYLTKKATVCFDPEARCPTWLTFLDQVLGGDEEFIRFIQKAVGYSLTGDTSEQVLFFLYGVGANGKSTFVNTLQTILGDYAQQAQVSTFMAKGKGAINNDIARLRGSRLVATTETEEGSRFNESELKQLTGGDTITARFLHQEHFEFKPNFKLWISGNHKPYIQGNDIGIWRRIKLIPFEVSVAPDEQDKELTTKLLGESSGVLNWALEGCRMWIDEGLGGCKIVDKATKAYRSEMDVISGWIKECCITDVNAEEQSSVLYNSFKLWALENGEYVVNNRKFKQKLEEKGILLSRASKGSMYSGLRLQEDLTGF